jgi:hypothetical protein
MFMASGPAWPLRPAATSFAGGAREAAESSRYRMSDTKFPRSERLRGRSELERVRKEGRRRALPELVLFFYPVK